MTLPNNIYDPVDVDQDYFLDHDIEREEFYTKALTLPGNILGILFNTETSTKMRGVSELFQLNPRQSEELSRLIRKILVAEVYLGNIVSEITSRLTIGPDIAKEIASRLITELFAPALEEIKKMHMEKFGNTPLPKPESSFAKATEDKANINPNNVLDLRKGN